MILIRTGINGSCFHSINESNNKKAVWLIAAGSSILFTLNEADGRLFFSWLFFCLLFLSAYVDYRLLIIPNEIITAKLFLWGLYSLFYIRPPLKIVQVIVGAVLFSGGILLLVVLLEKWKKRQKHACFIKSDLLTFEFWALWVLGNNEKSIIRVILGNPRNLSHKICQIMYLTCVLLVFWYFNK